jgi:2-(1,2-epoxy-1,2-dihydrophenyl)acetyl-CoA isomerase
VADADGIDVSGHDGIVIVRLNRPERKNALRRRDFEALTRVLEDADRDLSTRVIVLAGAGGNFSSGADQADMSGEEGPRATVALMWALSGTARALHRVRVPVLAAVSGLAIGAGSSLALGADLVYAGAGARFGQLFVDRALSLDLGASYVLVRRIGLARAKELAFTGAMVPAAEAERIGLVDRLFPDDDLEGEVLRLAGELAARPPLALAMIKNQLDRAMTLTFDEALDYESIGQALAAGSHDAVEARAAFFDKRPPTFTGH